MLEAPGRQYLKTGRRGCSVEVLCGVKCRQVSHEFEQHLSFQVNVVLAAQERVPGFRACRESQLETTGADFPTQTTFVDFHEGHREIAYSVTSRVNI
jgi:hypothetical protein